MFIANHPGVYVQEISTLPPSIAPGGTAIPVFIGYTEKSPPNSQTPNTPTPVRIETMLDYVTLFGGPCKKGFTVTVDENPPSGPSPIITVAAVADDNSNNFLMYYGLSLYFQNGGGSCYILSIGSYTDTPDKAHFQAALDALEKEDEPTLIVLLDATKLTPATDYYSLCQSALAQCQKLGDRFLLIDIPDKQIDTFRTSIGMNNLSYSAAYYPLLNTTLNYVYDERSVIVGDPCKNYFWSPDTVTNSNGFTISYTCTDGKSPIVNISKNTSATSDGFSFDTNTPRTLDIKIPNREGAITSAKKLTDEWTAWKKDNKNDPQGFDISQNKDGSNSVLEASVQNNFTDVTIPTSFAWSSTKSDNITDPNGFTVSYIGAANDLPKVKIAVGDDWNFTVTDASSQTLNITFPSTPSQAVKDLKNHWDAFTNKPSGFDIVCNGNGSSTVTALSDSTSLINSPTTLATLKIYKTALYNQIKTALTNQYVTLPPSPAIAGVYASVDRDRGVWKAPANVSLNSVIGPDTKISDTDQDGLNVDPTAGKSINAIRSFTGKGTLVWGARTLAGNDNEWRYVPVRRLFIFIEESTRKATSFAVFEPNDATTWLKVKAMIESFLYGLWQQGALAGSKPEQAYFVSVGLGKTMTPQDILEGKMIVTIGVAAVRPAEFIILTFSHKMQEA